MPEYHSAATHEYTLPENHCITVGSTIYSRSTEEQIKTIKNYAEQRIWILCRAKLACDHDVLIQLLYTTRYLLLFSLC